MWVGGCIWGREGNKHLAIYVCPATLLDLFLALPQLLSHTVRTGCTLLLVDRSSGAMNSLRKTIQKLVPSLYFQCSNSVVPVQ